MRVWIEHSERDVERVRALVTRPELQRRIENRRADWATCPDEITDAGLWHAMIACLVTSQQRSGPGSLVEAFLSLDPLPISLEACRQAEDVAVFVAQALAAARLRFGPKIGKFCQRNLSVFGEHRVALALDSLRDLLADPTPARERATARLFQNDAAHGLFGVGPKQSRNLLLNLGLMRHELPLDSRVSKWMRENLSEAGSRLVLSSTALLDEDYYSFVLDAVQRLCDDVGVLPSDFDAAAFYAT
jgi:hypothetical protein